MGDVRATFSRTDWRNCRVRSCRGSVKMCFGLPSSTTTPSAMKRTRSATSRANPISWVTTIIVMPSAAS
jgi:hypothetical protein